LPSDSHAQTNLLPHATSFLRFFLSRLFGCLWLSPCCHCFVLGLYVLSLERLRLGRVVCPRSTRLARPKGDLLFCPLAGTDRPERPPFRRYLSAISLVPSLHSLVASPPMYLASPLNLFFLPHNIRHLNIPVSFFIFLRCCRESSCLLTPCFSPVVPNGGHLGLGTPGRGRLAAWFCTLADRGLLCPSLRDG